MVCLLTDDQRNHLLRTCSRLAEEAVDVKKVSNMLYVYGNKSGVTKILLKIPAGHVGYDEAKQQWYFAISVLL